MGRISSRTDPTARVIAEMLRENTGTHFLDSGGAYGRNWQRNGARDFEREAPVGLSFEHGIEVGLNVYHFLKDRLEYSPAMDRRFLAFCEKPKNRDEGWLELADKFAEARSVDSMDRPYTRNTYNGDDLLSQVVQYVGFRDSKSLEGYVLLQVHGGCDVRGGYTRPRAFLYDEEGCDYSLLDNARARIVCRPNGNGKGLVRALHVWDTDDGCSWYPSHWAEVGLSEKDEAIRGKRLEEFPHKGGGEPEIGYLLLGRKEGSCPICLAPLEAY